MRAALITGASSGIGYELARFMAKKNHNLILVARSKDKLNDLADKIKSNYNIEVLIHDLDLSEISNCETLYTKIKEKDITIDILINNAGFGEYGYFIETDWDKEYAMMKLNMISLTYLTKIFLKEMVKNKSGRIMNVSSTAAFQPGPKMAVYYATKSFVQSFSEALANELNDENVSVTALCPGPTVSGFQNAANLEDAKIFNSMKLPSSREVAEYGYDAMMKGKVVAIHGKMNKLGVFSVRLTPRKLVTKIVRYLQENKKD